MNKNKERYYNITKDMKPHKNIIKFLDMHVKPGKAIDLGCGAGRDTIALLKSNWNVLAIDKENTEYIIREQLSKEEQERFTFHKSIFGTMELPNSNLIVANFSLPFAKEKYLDLIWNKINNSLLSDGYFVGNFFGKKDSWVETKNNLIFLTEEDVRKLFIEFEIMQFEEIEKDVKIASGEKNIGMYMISQPKKQETNLHKIIKNIDKGKNILYNFNIKIVVL